MGEQLKSSAAMMEEGGAVFMRLGVWMPPSTYLQMRPLCTLHPQQCFPTSPPVKVLPAFKASSRVLSADPNSCLPVQSLPLGLDSEVLASVCCSPERACELLLVAGMASLTDMCTLTCTSSPTSKGQWHLPPSSRITLW